MPASGDLIRVRRKPLEDLIAEAKRYLRRHGGTEANGAGGLTEALRAVVRDVASAELDDELAEPLPLVPQENPDDA